MKLVLLVKLQSAFLSYGIKPLIHLLNLSSDPTHGFHLSRWKQMEKKKINLEQLILIMHFRIERQINCAQNSVNQQRPQQSKGSVIKTVPFLGFVEDNAQSFPLFAIFPFLSPVVFVVATQHCFHQNPLYLITSENATEKRGRLSGSGKWTNDKWSATSTNTL